MENKSTRINELKDQFAKKLMMNGLGYNLDEALKDLKFETLTDALVASGIITYEALNDMLQDRIIALLEKKIHVVDQAVVEKQKAQILVPNGVTIPPEGLKRVH